MDYNGCALHSQSDVDLAFADLEHYLSTERPSPPRSGGNCVSCGGISLNYSSSDSSHPGSLVCSVCGAVQSSLVIYEYMYGRDVTRRFSNYKRIHHWHERISQLLILESQIPDHHMLQIAEKLCDGTHTILCKDSIRKVLRSLNMQTYIEKWLQVIQRLTGISPPLPGPALLIQLDNMFMDLQRPFDQHVREGRKNFLNYNYVFCRLFQLVGCTKFCMFFPLIKSKMKLRVLDEMWGAMAKSLNWKCLPLVRVTPFAVHLRSPESLLCSLRQTVCVSDSVEPASEQTQTKCHVSGRLTLNKTEKMQLELLSRQPVQLSPEVAAAVRHRPRKRGAERRLPRLQQSRTS